MKSSLAMIDFPAVERWSLPPRSLVGAVSLWIGLNFVCHVEISVAQSPGESPSRKPVISASPEADVSEDAVPLLKFPGASSGRKPYPAHWGKPPQIQTRDLRPLPGGYGMGSGTLARWIRDHLARDEARALAASWICDLAW